MLVSSQSFNVYVTCQKLQSDIQNYIIMQTPIHTQSCQENMHLKNSVNNF